MSRDQDRATDGSATEEAAGQIVVFGSLNADLTVRVERFPEGGETLSGSELVTAPGGKSSNQAVAAAVLGSSVRLIGAVGDDAHGRFLRDKAEEAGVDVSGVVRDAGHATGSAMIVVDSAGENTIIVSPGANGRHTGESVGSVDFGGASILCLCLEVPLAAVAVAAAQGQEAGAQVVLNLSPYVEVPSQLLEHTDVLLVNESEVALVIGQNSPGEDWPSTLHRLVELGVSRAVVTLGAGGAVVLDDAASGDHRVISVASPSVEAVDTTGCGDAFTGALAHTMAAGSSLVEAATMAAQVAAQAATREGAQVSYAAFTPKGTATDD